MSENRIRRLRGAAILLLIMSHAVAVAAAMPGEEMMIHRDQHFALGVGLGLVEFDTNAKVIQQRTGRSYFVDLEGDLGLPNYDQVNTIYGGFRFNEKHSLQFGYFAIKRDNRLLDESANFNDIIVLEATIDISDRSKFYNLAYGYNLFEDDCSDVTLIVGLKSIDLQLSAEARGEITVLGESRTATEVVESDVIAPIPLPGVDLGFNFTPEWSVSTRVGLVGGSYQDVSAAIIETSINSRYQFSKSVGLLLGITYFDAGIDIEDDDEITEVSYGYSGAFLGRHFSL